jgi:predicted signal transduction protein with EAL and GGDEF domain
VVAEGVETAAQRQALGRLGCTLAQGFLFAPPMPVERIGPTLRSLAAAGAQGEVVRLAADGGTPAAGAAGLRAGGQA